MLFNSFQFLIFFPCVFLLYYALPFRLRNGMLLLSSYYFYMCWKPELVVLILFSTVVDYGCGLGISRWRKRKGIFLAISLTMNLGLLFFFKYFNFFGETLTALCRAVSIPFSVPVLDLILPVGISFYTFQTLSYTIDIYRGKLEPERNFITFALFVSFFPQLVAGPIERAESLLPQLKQEHRFSYDNAVYGLKLMAWGFFKKCVVADSLAAIVDPIYNNISSYAGGALVAATCAFAFQIYCDFSGYSDIARGCARMMGVELMVNFRHPWLSSSVSDFWRQWHISLSSWFREYIYIPLGGNRKGVAKKLLFLMIVFLTSGLWHGAAWTFVAWGFLHGLFLSLESLAMLWRKRRTGMNRTGAVGRAAGIVWTFCLTTLAWVFFRANMMGDALYAVRYALVGLSDPIQYLKNTYSSILSLTGWSGLAIAIFAVTVLLAFDIADERGDVLAAVGRWPMAVRWCVYIVFLLLLVMLIPREAPAPFIYFQF